MSMKPALAEKLAEIRREKKYSMKELADLSGVNYTYLSKLLAGRHIPSPKTLEKLADALQYPIEPLLRLYEDLPRQILSRLISEQGCTNIIARGVGGETGTWDANVPKPIREALQQITSDGKETANISAVLSAIAKVEPEKREKLLDIITNLIKLHVPSEEDEQ